MGLDSYWIKPDESKSQPLDFDPPLVFEDDGDQQARHEGWAHFRSRSFECLIEEITGVSLRSECLDNGTVKRMADLLASYAANPWELPPSQSNVGSEHWSHHERVSEIVSDLARLFQAYAREDYGLFGSW
jgi:hypothetical protein